MPFWSWEHEDWADACIREGIGQVEGLGHICPQGCLCFVPGAWHTGI